MKQDFDIITVVIADDHAVVRSGLRLLLDKEQDIRVVEEVGNGREAIEIARRLQPDIMLLDISMPLCGGLTALPKIKEVSPETRILVLTMHNDEEYARQVLASGGAGYILKEAADEMVVAAIRQVFRGQIYVDTALVGALLSNIIPAPISNDPWDELSEREQEVISLVAWGHTSQEIAEKLHLSANTVDTYRARAMHKLGLTNRVQLVRYAVARGLLNE